MSNLVLEIYLSYSQICVFQSALENPFNDWSERNYSQGFSWRPGSVSFRALLEEGKHQINLFINEAIPPLPEKCVRTFKVPFSTVDGAIEIASISDSASLELTPGKYALQVEFLRPIPDRLPEINIRINKANKAEADFEILKADNEIETNAELDLMANPAT